MYNKIKVDDRGSGTAFCKGDGYIAGWGNAYGSVICCGYGGIDGEVYTCRSFSGYGKGFGVGYGYGCGAGYAYAYGSGGDACDIKNY